MIRRTAIVLALAVSAAAVPLYATGEAQAPFRILITNDDGIDSEGIAALVRELAPIADVTVAAPARNHSGAGQSVTLFGDPVRVDARQVGGANGYAVHGTPADSVIFGLLRARSTAPAYDLVISGINKGENVGESAYVSGTVGAARQAVMMGVPAIAISQQYTRGEYDFSVAARYAAHVAAALHAQRVHPVRLVSINVPSGTPRGVRRVPARGMPFSMNGLDEVRGADGTISYRLRLDSGGPAPRGGDTEALNAGFITVSILGIDPNGSAADLNRLPASISRMPR